MGSGSEGNPAPPRLQDDFYRHVNAEWLASNPVPPEYSRWGTFEKLNDEALAKIFPWDNFFGGSQRNYLAKDECARPQPTLSCSLAVQAHGPLCPCSLAAVRPHADLSRAHGSSC